jgi:hypothetical protein
MIEAWRLDNVFGISVAETRGEGISKEWRTQDSVPVLQVMMNERKA